MSALTASELESFGNTARDLTHVVSRPAGWTLIEAVYEDEGGALVRFTSTDRGEMALDVPEATP